MWISKIWILSSSLFVKNLEVFLETECPKCHRFMKSILLAVKFKSENSCMKLSVKLFLCMISLLFVCFHIKVREMAKSIHPDMLAVVCGSYRRGKQTCGDVDVLISHPDGKSHKGVLSKILEGLRQKGEYNQVCKFFNIFLKTTLPTKKYKSR